MMSLPYQLLLSGMTNAVTHVEKCVKGTQIEPFELL